jgi:hypothetical protein
LVVLRIRPHEIIKRGGDEVTKTALEKQRNDLNRKLWAIQEREDAERLKPYVGRFYKYDNGYNERERWNLYTKVIGVEGSMLICDTFQTDSYGEMRFQPKQAHGESTCQTEIEAREFNTAWKEFVAAFKLTRATI